MWKRKTQKLKQTKSTRSVCGRVVFSKLRARVSEYQNKKTKKKEATKMERKGIAWWATAASDWDVCELMLVSRVLPSKDRSLQCHDDEWIKCVTTLSLVLVAGDSSRSCWVYPSVDYVQLFSFWFASPPPPLLTPSHSFWHSLPQQLDAAAAFFCVYILVDWILVTTCCCYSFVCSHQPTSTTPTSCVVADQPFFRHFSHQHDDYWRWQPTSLVCSF